MGWQDHEALDAPRRLALRRALTAARAASDAVFARLDPAALHDRPVRERHRLAFYLGHLEAFDANLLAGLIDDPGFGFAPALDRLFARGIDPLDDDVPTDAAGDWPRADELGAYGQRSRAAVDAALAGDAGWQHPHTRGGLALEVAIEHRLMHVETLAYLLHQLPLGRVAAIASAAPPLTPPPQHRLIAVPAGSATLGRDHGFGWDNEFDQHAVDVAAFAIDAYPVTNRAYLPHVVAGRCAPPHVWRATADGWRLRRFVDEVPLASALDAPVYVTHAEATAFAAARHARLPTEAEWHRATYGAPDGERAQPWGDAPFDGTRGNADLARDDATAVTAHPRGASAWGVQNLIGNGWEWTSTVFAPFAGFAPFPFYAGYSADFFDGRHFVLKGGSARTAARLLRRSFRDWFQPHYPHVYATFRCVEA